MHQIRKPIRPKILTQITGLVERGVQVRPVSVSLGTWSKDTNWRSQTPITRSLEDIDWVWVSSFRTSKVPIEMQNLTAQDADQLIRYYLDLVSGRDHTSKKRVGLQSYDIARLFRNVMLWCLKYRKRQALMLLLATFKSGKYRPPRYIVSNSLQYLARHFLFKVFDPDPTAIERIRFLACKFIEGAVNQEQVFDIDQQLIYNLSYHSDDTRILSLYWLLSANKAVVHCNTMLHFLHRFVDMGKIQLAMNILVTVTKTGFQLSREEVTTSCAKLLRARFDALDAQTEYSVRSNIFTQILEMGIRPSIGMCNVMIMNAGEGGDFHDAWQMYLLVRGSALIPDPITFAVLMKGARLSGDVSNIKMVIREIENNEKVLHDPPLVYHVLLSIRLISLEDPFSAMFNFYKQHCDVRPLQELSLLGDETQAPSGEEGQGFEPSRLILSNMIMAYIQSYERSPGLVHVYDRYYRAVKEKHPVIAQVAEHEGVANSFITAFGRRSDTLHHCTTVIKHMLEFSSPKFSSSNQVAYTAPTVKTWTALAGAYLHNDQRRAAMKVFEMMRERGIAGSHVTWNVLLRNFARSQDVEAAAHTLKGMEAAGFKADEYTAKALNMVRRQDLLVKALEGEIETPKTADVSNWSTLPSLGPEDELEAYTNLELESDVPDLQSELGRYLETKRQEMLNPDFEKPSESLVEFANDVCSDP